MLQVFILSSLTVYVIPACLVLSLHLDIYFPLAFNNNSGLDGSNFVTLGDFSLGRLEKVLYELQQHEGGLPSQLKILNHVNYSSQMR